MKPMNKAMQMKDAAQCHPMEGTKKSMGGMTPDLESGHEKMSIEEHTEGTSSPLLHGVNGKKNSNRSY